MNRRAFFHAMAWGTVGMLASRCASLETSPGWVLHDYYGHIHFGNGVAPGIDYKVRSSPPYTEIVPCASGWVWDTGWDHDAGEYITVTHGLGYYTMYAHLKERFVTEGAPVERDRVMALGGNTGRNARGIWHLHLGLLVPDYAWHEDYLSPGGGKRWADPDMFSESGRRLEIWKGNALDLEFQREVRAAAATVESLWESLIARGSEAAGILQRRAIFPFDRTLALIERAHQRCAPCQASHEAPEFLNGLQRLKRLRPTLTLPFPNPALASLYVRPLLAPQSSAGSPGQPQR